MAFSCISLGDNYALNIELQNFAAAINVVQTKYSVPMVYLSGREERQNYVFKNSFIYYFFSFDHCS